jgi:ATP citrate (pro-S)-lyase
MPQFNMCIVKLLQTGGTVSRQSSENMSSSAAVNGTPSAGKKDAPFSMAGVHSLFENNTKAIIWGQQTKAIQGMLDFDYVCRREQPSVVASTYPFTGDHRQKFYFGQKEILLPGMHTS